MCITVLVLTINSVFLSLKRWQLNSKQKDLGFWPQKLEKKKKKLVIVWIQEKDSLRSVFYGCLTLSFIKNFKCWLGHFLSLISPMHFAQSQAGAWYTINILRTTNQSQLCVGTHTGHTHTPPLPAPPSRKAGLPGGAVIPLPEHLLPQLTPPREADALVLGPRFKLSSSHWPGPASFECPKSLDKQPKPWPFSRTRDLPAVLRLHCVCPWSWLHPWTSLTHDVTVPTHTLVFSLLLHIHTHGLYITYPPERDCRFPLDCHWRANSQGHTLCVRHLPGRWEWMRGKAKCGLLPYSSSQGGSRLDTKGQTLAVVQSLSCVWLFVTPWLQHARLPRSSLFSGDCSDSCPLSHWCYLTVSPSAALFFCLQSFPAWGSFALSWPLTSD